MRLHVIVDVIPATVNSATSNRNTHSVLTMVLCVGRILYGLTKVSVISFLSLVVLGIKQGSIVKEKIHCEPLIVQLRDAQLLTHLTHPDSLSHR